VLVPIVKSSPDMVRSPVTVALPAIVVTEAVPLPIVTSISSSALPSVNIKPF